MNTTPDGPSCPSRARKPAPNTKPYLTLCKAEPYRLFFPLGTLLGISGVSLWPLFFLGYHKFYPGLMHARLMIEGFMTAFVIGFLGTAVPRLLSAPPLRGWELGTLVVLLLSATGLQIGHQLLWGDVTFALLLIVFATFLLRRLRSRVELPPPSFALVALGYLSGLIGTLLWVGGMRGWVSPNLMLMGGMWLNEAFVYLLILGVGGFLLPRFLRVEGLRPLDEERKASPEWRRRAGWSLLVGLVFLGSFWFQVADQAVAGAHLTRAIVAILYLTAMVQVHRGRGWQRAVSQAVVVSLLALVIGLLFPLFAEGQRIAALHVVFVAGFSLITFTVATRVVLGHSGHGELFDSSLPPLRTALYLLVAGAILRVWGDFSAHRIPLLNWASYLWMLAAVVWGAIILPKVRIAGGED